MLWAWSPIPGFEIARPGPPTAGPAAEGGCPARQADAVSVPPQKDFTVREALQQQDVERWLGFITFLCEVFGTMRSSTGEPFRVLVCPIYTCLREVRPAPERDVWDGAASGGTRRAVAGTSYEATILGKETRPSPCCGLKPGLY